MSIVEQNKLVVALSYILTDRKKCSCGHFLDTHTPDRPGCLKHVPFSNGIGWTWCDCWEPGSYRQIDGEDNHVILGLD